MTDLDFEKRRFWVLIAGLFAAIIYLGINATVLLASEPGGASVEMAPFSLKTEIWRYVNFALIFFMIFFLARKPLKAFFASHKDKVARELEEARKAKEEATKKLKEYETRMANFEQEIDQIKSETDQQKELIKEKILGDADAAISKIMAQARQNIEADRKKALHDIRIEAAELTIAMSEEILRKNIQRGDQERLIDEYLDQVGGVN